MATMADVASHLDVSEETVRQLKRRGVISAAARGLMDLDACRTSYIRHLREQAAGRSSDAAEAEGFDLVKQRGRLASYKADRAEMENARLRGELVAIAAVDAAIIGLIELSKAQLARIPARIAGADVKLREKIAAAIEEALEELTQARVEEEIGGGDAEADEDED